MDRGRTIPRPGIRGKILICFAILLVFFLSLTLILQNEAVRLSKEYGASLNRYHLVHRFRLDLEALHQQADRYLREPLSAKPETVFVSIATLNAEYASLLPLSDTSIKVEFEIRATGYGLDVYLPLISRAVNLRASRASDYYPFFVHADRIYGYLNTYLNRALSELMRQGEETYAALTRRSEAVNRAILISMIVASFLAVMAIILVAQYITSPLRRLAKEAEKLAAGDLDAGIVEAHTKDEVETLTKAFASMARSIRDMVEGLKEKAELERLLHEEELALVSMGKALREAQFMNLQEQMKPHFLFNALNIIARSALLENAPRTESLALSLARLLRALIGDSGAKATLASELRLAEDYLEFQEARFGERLRWNIDVPKPARACSVPHLLLQPLVENAVRHGLEPKVNGGTIQIKARLRDGFLVLWIRDDGIGMTSERLKEIRTRVRSATQRKTTFLTSRSLDPSSA
ncbi:MAG: histidine kinase, partial [Rectinema sp.]|nr:histidine kinase [Rectinema sp.]